MTIEEIKDAALNGKTFTIKNARVESMDFGSVQSCIDEFGNPIFVKTVNVKFVSPDIKDSIFVKDKDYPDIEVCEQPKYDPCRLLKEGDKVQVVKRNGRCWGKTGEYLRGAYCFVLEDEERNAMVKVRHNSSEYTIDPAYLELVTPVEEL